MMATLVLGALAGTFLAVSIAFFYLKRKGM